MLESRGGAVDEEGLEAAKERMNNVQEAYATLGGGQGAGSGSFYEAIGGKEGYGSYAQCLRRPSEMYPFLNSTEEHVYVCECNPM